jgi:hypothetical protein
VLIAAITVGLALTIQDSGATDGGRDPAIHQRMDGDRGDDD